MSDDTTKKAVKLDTAICVCNQKATAIDKLIECHNDRCMNGKFFHLSCMNCKRKPNNAKTTWICPNCSAANLYDTKAKVKVKNSNSVKASTCKQCQHTQQWKFKWPSVQANFITNWIVEWWHYSRGSSKSQEEWSYYARFTQSYIRSCSLIDKSY